MTSHKLLLADDSATIRKVVELTFADEGIEVSAVADGDAAMQKFVEIQPDLVLVDVNMPGPSGYQICEMIKQDEATKHIPVLLLVGSFEPFDQTEAERVGADGFLTKPFQSIRELVDKVAELLGPEDPLAHEVAETADIDNLYKSSFEEVVKTPAAAETFLGDAGMDDEMIEASYPAEPAEETDVNDLVPHIEEDESMAKIDWSAGLAEPLTESAEPLTESVEPMTESVEPMTELVEPVTELAEPWTESAEPVNGGFEPRFVFEEPEPLEMPRSGEPDLDEYTAHETGSGADISEVSPEPSAEFIAMVARMVVEKLSDKVIREIAKEAVPRIAENLIREALEDEKKN